MDNDVAVIRTNTHFSGPNTGYIGLVPLGYEPMAGVRAIVTGWGRQVGRVREVQSYLKLLCVDSKSTPIAFHIL